MYTVYFAINAARQNKDTNRHMDTHYTNIKLQPIQRCRPWTWWCNDAMALAGYYYNQKEKTKRRQHIPGTCVV